MRGIPICRVLGATLCTAGKSTVRIGRLLREAPYDPNSIAELKTAEIVIFHSLHSGVDINSVYAQAREARTAAGYNESGFRIMPDGLKITCSLGFDINRRINEVTLLTPEG